MEIAGKFQAVAATQPKAEFGIAKGSALQLRSLFEWLYVHNAPKKR
jgi:hypothetical protein